MENDLPKKPDFPDDEITKIIERGTQRRYFTNLHKHLKN